MAYRRTDDVIVAFCKGIWIPESGKFFIVESQRTLKYEKNISERLVRGEIGHFISFIMHLDPRLSH